MDETDVNLRMALAPKEDDGAGTEAGDASGEKSELVKFAAGLSLAISFASICGGMATVIGTPTNVVFYGMVTE